MSTTTVYTTPGCAQCGLTFRALDKANLDYTTLISPLMAQPSPESRNSATHRPR